ncbi:pilus assembly protein [Paracoccus sp. Z118]|nr:pilus assembly protein [Paracoccus sp. Z118]
MTCLVQLRRTVRCGSGTAAIEFALVGLLAISLILGVIEFGRAVFIRNELAFAADIATRRALIDPPKTSGDLERLEAAIRESITFNRDRLEVELELPSSGGMQITLRQPLTLLVPGLYEDSITLTLDRYIPLS